MHLIKECSLICKNVRSSSLKEDRKTKNNFPAQLDKRKWAYRFIKRISDTNILDEIEEKFIKRDHGNESEDENLSSFINKSNVFRIENMTINVRTSVDVRSSKASYNLLEKSAIYDSDCSDHLTFNEKRFIDEIKSACEWVNISNESMQIEGYETMKVVEKLNDEIIIMKFSKTAWTTSINVTLIFSTKLMKQRFDRCPRTQTLMKMNSGQKICEIFMKFNLLVVEYNEFLEKEFDFNEEQTNFIRKKVE
jgi:hypothetical protein